MSVTININGDLVLDQTAGIQVENDDVEVINTAGTLSGALDQNFLDYLNTLALSPAGEDFADLVEGASDPDLVTISATEGETIGKLFFSDPSGNDFDGDLVSGVTTLDGQPLFFWSDLGGKVVLVKTAGGDIAAAFYIESTDPDNLTAKVESITFMPLLHTNVNDPDDTVDFTDFLRVAAVVTQGVGDDILVDDDGPTIAVSSDSVQLTVDESDFNTDDSASFANEFTSNFGTDGAGGIEYVLDTVGGASGLIDSLSGENVILSKEGDDIVGRTENGLELVFIATVDANGNVSLDQSRSVRHTPDSGPDQSTTLAADNLITLTATITDGDGDDEVAVLNIGQNLNFEDDPPNIAAGGDEPNTTVDETNLGLGAIGDYAPNFAGFSFGADGAGDIDFDLTVQAGLIAGLIDTVSGEAIDLQLNGDVVEAKTAISGDLVFTVSVDDDGKVTFTQARSVTHADDTNPDDVRAIGAADLITLTATITDSDGDTDSAFINIGDNLMIADDGPVVTVPSSAPDAANAAHLGNAVGETITGDFGYDIGSDAHNDAFYTAGGSDFVDFDALKLDVQLALGGTVNGPPVTGMIDSDVTRTFEDAHTAVFDWSFTYDADPLTADVQLGTAAGTLTFDKDLETFTIAVTDEVEGFSFSVLHTSELLRKAPPGNTGHPEIVVSELDDAADGDGFYVQFTANSLNQQNQTFGFNSTGDGSPVAGDTTFNAGQMVTNNFEDWVSATQTTNGVAGDTIQKGELLTLRFFDENILGTVNPNAPGGGTELLTETDSVNGIAIKFDGIGNSEDLVVVLDLIDFDGADNIAGNGDDNATTTKSIIVSNSDMIKLSTGGVPAPYNTEFTLDNNDALVVIESNDYNFGTENYQIQGVQIMQSGNGLTGTGINLNGLTGDSGGSSGTQAWENTDNDVLKIVDIGFIQTTSGTQDASLDFSFDITDGDQDLLGVQHIHALISNDFLI